MLQQKGNRGWTHNAYDLDHPPSAEEDFSIFHMFHQIEHGTEQSTCLPWHCLEIATEKKIIIAEAALGVCHLQTTPLGCSDAQ